MGAVCQKKMDEVADRPTNVQGSDFAKNQYLAKNLVNRQTVFSTDLPEWAKKMGFVTKMHVQECENKKHENKKHDNGKHDNGKDDNDNGKDENGKQTGGGIGKDKDTYYEFPEATLHEKHELSESWVTKKTFIKVYGTKQREEMWKSEVSWYLCLNSMRTLRHNQTFVLPILHYFVSRKPICKNQNPAHGVNYILVMERADYDLMQYANLFAELGGLSEQQFNNISEQLVEIVDTLIDNKIFASDLCLENFLILNDKVFLADLTDLFVVKNWVDPVDKMKNGRFHAFSTHPLFGEEPVDYRSLMFFSLGCCLLQLLVGLNLSSFRSFQMLEPGAFLTFFSTRYPLLSKSVEQRSLTHWLPFIDECFSHGKRVRDHSTFPEKTKEKTS